MQAEDSGKRVEARIQPYDGFTAVRQLALRFSDAARTLGISVESFERYVEPEIKILRLGTMKLVPVVELEQFIADKALRVGGDW